MMATISAMVTLVVKEHSNELFSTIKKTFSKEHFGKSLLSCQELEEKESIPASYLYDGYETIIGNQLA